MNLAGTLDKKKLLQLIRSRLEKQFNFSHHLIYQINDQNSTITLLMSDVQSPLSDNIGYESVRDQEFPFAGTIYDSIIRSIEPIIFDLADLAVKGLLPPQLKIKYDSGIEKVIMIPLNLDDKLQGIWTIEFASTLPIHAKDLKLIKTVATPISVAVANIRLNESLKMREEQLNDDFSRRESENEMLLSLSGDIAAVRDKKQLINVIKNRLKPGLRFTHFALGVKLPDNTIVSFLNDPDSKAKIHPGYSKVFRQEREQCEDFIDYINQSPYPVILNNSNIGMFTDLPYVVMVNFESGIKEILIAKLFDGVSIFGYCFFFFDKKDIVSKEQFGLIKGIANQFSTAIYNIKANLEIAKRETDNELLISLSNTTARLRNFSQLMELISARFSNVFSFERYYIGMQDDVSNSFKVLTLDAESINGKIDSTSKHNFFDISIDADFHRHLKANSLPIIIDLKSDHRMSLRGLVNESELGYAVLCRFVHNEKILGIWIMLYREREKIDTGLFRLLQGVNDQLSNSVANIMANDRLYHREQEKVSLLEFTQAIAGVQDRSQLRKIFSRYLSNLCFIDDICLHWLSEDKQSQACYFCDQSATGLDDSGILNDIDMKFTIGEDIFSKIIKSGTQHRFKVKELINQTHLPSYVRFLNCQDGENIVGIPLLRGSETVGVLFVKDFDSANSDQPLLRGLCTQLAIAISNLVSSERILEQFSQIKMYKERLEEEKVYLKQELETSHHYSEIIGDSPQMKAVFQMVSQVAMVDSTVLILGETGTGKELVARAIHNNSSRKNKLLVKVNCAALPSNLIESELFGHEKGAFTGATERRVGKFELANGGSLFLDEIGEMPLELQSKLLRALQEREIERVGGKGAFKVDVRIITATNRNLEQQAAEGKFRPDLYFRLSTFPIHLPALRNRRTDIPELAGHFLNRFAKKSGKIIHQISQKAMQDLVNYNWPGNVRELEHQIERSVIMTAGDTIKKIYLPTFDLVGSVQEESLLIRTIDDNERELIIRALRHCNGKVSGRAGAAEMLGVPSTTLNAKIKRLGIRKNFSR